MTLSGMSYNAPLPVFPVSPRHFAHLVYFGSIALCYCHYAHMITSTHPRRYRISTAERV
jgi:hypothetical protein